MRCLRDELKLDSFFIGMDLGTTNLKAVVISTDGKILAKTTEPMSYNTGGSRVEFDVDEFYGMVCMLNRCLLDALPRGAGIGGVCISSASGNTVLLDKNDRPLIPAISWLDTKQKTEIEAVMGKLDPSEVYRLVGWPLGEMFPLAHLCWLKQTRSDLIEEAAKIGMSSDYVNLRLVGAWAMDHSTATTFFLRDQAAGKWHMPFLDKLGIDPVKLPRLLPTGTMIGSVTPAASAETSLPAGTPVFLGSFDHPSAAVGAGITKEGQLLLSCGTSWVGFTPVRDRERILQANLLCDPFLEKENLWGGYFSLPNAAQRVDLYLDKFIPNEPGRHCLFDALSAKAEPGAGGLKLNVYDDPPDNLNEYEKSQIARALMESVACLFTEKLKALEKYGINIKDITMAGGPSRSPIWSGIISDAIGMPVKVLPDGINAGALGAAKIAKQAVVSNS